MEINIQIGLACFILYYFLSEIGKVFNIVFQPQNNIVNLVMSLIQVVITIFGVINILIFLVVIFFFRVSV